LPSSSTPTPHDPRPPRPCTSRSLRCSTPARPDGSLLVRLVATMIFSTSRTSSLSQGQRDQTPPLLSVARP
jgi:hypothetical protein